jgi:hypothetical protein
MSAGSSMAWNPAFTVLYRQHYRRRNSIAAILHKILPSLLFVPSSLSSLVLHLLTFSGASHEELDGPADKWPTVVTPWGHHWESRQILGFDKIAGSDLSVRWGR